MGFTNATADRKTEVPAGRYRWGLSLVSTISVGLLLDDNGGGLRERFLFMPAAEPALAVAQRHPDAGGLEIPLPPKEAGVIPVCQRADDDVWSRTWPTMPGSPPGTAP